MSEQHTMSVGDIERANAAASAHARAKQALGRAGADADDGTLEILYDEFPQLRQMESTLVEYNEGLSDIINSTETDTDAREAAYEDLVSRTEPTFEAAAAELEGAVRVRRRELQHKLFGHSAETSFSNAAAIHAQQMNYRDAIYTAANAKDSELEEHMSIAEATNDAVLAKATAAIADKRGHKDIVYRYLAIAGVKAHETYTRRNALPTDSSISALVSAYRPKRVSRGSLTPSAQALEIKRRREAQKDTKRRQLFRQV